MLRDFRVHPLLAAADAARARAWYADKLGLEPVFEREGQLVYSLGAGVLTVYQTEFAGTAQNTVAVWDVDDLRAEMVRLRARGLVFEELDFGPDDRTVDGLMTTADGSREVLNAWFKDADGNWISLVQQQPEPGEEPPVPGVVPMLAASNLERARAWYAEKLGLEPSREYDGELLVYRSGQTHLSIYGTPSAGTARNTVAEWHVDDLRAEVAALRARGVVFEEYHFGGARTIDGVMRDPSDGSLNAWFTDSEGSILGLVQGQGDHMT
jgi:catechol 2,3-dioxygenase-like lactoylglutathione lyase family enzyme